MSYKSKPHPSAIQLVNPKVTKYKMNNQVVLHRDPELPMAYYFSRNDDILLLSFYLIFGSNFEKISCMMKRTPREVRLRFKYLLLIVHEGLGLILPSAMFFRDQRPAEERSQLANNVAQNEDVNDTSDSTNH